MRARRTSETLNRSATLVIGAFQTSSYSSSRLTAMTAHLSLCVQQLVDPLVGEAKEGGCVPDAEPLPPHEVLDRGRDVEAGLVFRHRQPVQRLGGGRGALGG